LGVLADVGFPSKSDRNIDLPSVRDLRDGGTRTTLSGWREVPQNKNGAVCLVVPARLSRKSHLTYVVCTLSAAGGDDEDQRFHSWLEHRCDGACIIVGASQDASGHSNVADADAGDSAPAYSDGAHADAPSGSSAAADWLPDPS